MLATIRSAGIRGIDSFPIRVEVHLRTGLPTFTVVGLPEGAVREGKERVSAALDVVGSRIPIGRITVNLAPADVRKEGSALDLPIAIGLLVASGAVEQAQVDGLLFVGELGLDGALRPIRGAISIAGGARRQGARTLVVPAPNAREAHAAADDVEVIAPHGIGDLIGHLSGRAPVPPFDPRRSRCARKVVDPPCFGDVRGQAQAKRALEVAAAGGHNVLLTGPPGAGKTMLTRRLPGILPPLTTSEALEVTAIHSVAGCLGDESGLLDSRPFRAPHHTISAGGLVGGGSVPRPGEVSLAHRGVLFLDELPEFRRHALEALRQPVEDGVVRISRVRGSVRFPARPMLACAMNLCPCGHLGDGTDRCLCDPGAVRRYRGRISGPLLDRIDLVVRVPAVPVRELMEPGSAEGSGPIGERVREARARQSRRALVDGAPGITNAELSTRTLRSSLHLPDEAPRLLRRATEQLGVSARGVYRILRVARTIADLEGTEGVAAAHLAEAIQYRGVDRS